MHRAASHAPQSTAERPAWWQWPSVLSLEVPLIAVVWQRLFGSALGGHVRWPESLLLGLVVWLIYSADRLLDGLGKQARNTTRHQFYIRHCRSVVSVWLVICIGSLGLALTLLEPQELVGGALLAAAMLGYFFSRHRGRPERHPKEAQIALLFALGVGLMPLLGGASPALLLLFSTLFATLIFLNCAFIALWEGAHDLEPAPFASRHPRLAHHLRSLALSLAWSCALVIVILPTTSALGLALVGSSLLLYSLDSPDLATRLGPEARRVVGDAALLTPLLILLWLHA